MNKNFEVVEENAVDSPVQNIKWYGHEDRTEDKGMHDKGKGDPVLIRLFEFKLDPTKELPTKEHILTNEYIRHLQATLWGDGLRLVQAPECVIDKESIKIYAPCVATTGNNFLEKPKMLQEWIN